MYDEGPTERQIEDWNTHNDHADQEEYLELAHHENYTVKDRPKWLPKFVHYERNYSHNYYSAFKGRITVTTDRDRKECVINIGRHEPKGLKFNLTLGKNNEYLTFSWQGFYQRHDQPPF